MITRKDEHETAVMESAFGGSGSLEAMRLITSPEELYGKGRLFNICTLQPGSELGWHVHKGDGEFYHILSGVGEYNENGNVTTVYPGDTTFTDDGEGHSMKNIGAEPLVFVALILYK